MRFLLAVFCLVASYSSALAERATFTFLRTVTVAELNTILDAERTTFLRDATPGPGYELPPAPKATNAVDLFRVRYYSKSPDLGGKEIMASGLLALPKIADRSSIRLMSYQHGTVMGKYEVPSYAFARTNPTGQPHYLQAYETRYMTGLFAGNGYAVMAADYYGFGDGASFKEAYFIKNSTAQANYDLYLDVMKYLAANNIKPSKLMLGGWSQGGLNTTGFLQVLEAKGVKVDAVFTAASLNDPYANINPLLFHPREADARWMVLLLGLTTFSCENYLGPRGLAKAVIAKKYYNDMKRIYDRTYAGPLELLNILGRWQNVPFTEFLQPAYLDRSYLARSDYGKCLAAGETYRQAFKAPIRMYYGSHDQLIRPRVALLAHDYQQTITDVGTPGAIPSSQVEAFRVEGADHGLAFMSGSLAAKAWMDSLR
jgi:dienelactone hydrolase